MDQSIYEIHVAGTVPAEDLQDMGAVRVGAEQVNTVLYGVPDEAALFGHSASRSSRSVGFPTSLGQSLVRATPTMWTPTMSSRR